MRVAAAWPLLASLACHGACHGPNPDYIGVHGATGTSAAIGDSGDEDTDGDDTSSNVDSSCGDGQLDPGEFCFRHAELLWTFEVQSLAAADFDADGHVDLAVGRRDDVLVLLGDGSGGFPLRVELPEPYGHYHGAAAGLLDADARADLVVTHEHGDALLVYRSLGAGAFAAPVSFPLGDEPRSVLLAHVDDDATLDAIATLRGTDEIAVLLGNGDAGFVALTTHATGGYEPLELGLAAFGQGSGIDIAVANHASRQVALLPGIGPGQFAAPQVYTIAGTPRSVAIADFDLDGSPDVAAVLDDLDAVELLIGDGNGGLDLGVGTIAVGHRPVGALAQDLDHDGAADLVVLNHDDRSVGVLFNDPNAPGSFGAYQTLQWFDGLTRLTTIIAADLDGDGVDDVIVGGDGVEAMLSNP